MNNRPSMMDVMMVCFFLQNLSRLVLLVTATEQWYHHDALVHSLFPCIFLVSLRSSKKMSATMMCVPKKYDRVCRRGLGQTQEHSKQQCPPCMVIMRCRARSQQQTTCCQYLCWILRYVSPIPPVVSIMMARITAAVVTRDTRKTSITLINRANHGTNSFVVLPGICFR